MNDLTQFFDQILGLSEGVKSLTLMQVAMRAILIYLVGYMMLRVGEHRFLGKNTPFDVVLGFIFGTTLSRAINGAAPFIDTIAAGAILLFLHWLFATLTFHSDRLNVWLNGAAIPLIRDGSIDWDNMRKERINHRLLDENLRLNGHLTDPEDVAEAFYERSGNISIIPKSSSKGPRVLEVKVEEGVQTVRIALES